MSPPLAMMFAKLLHVGCPARQALLYCLPTLAVDPAKPEQVRAWAEAWVRDSLVQQAMETVIGGAWMDMPAETRYKLAVDKQLSEMAFYCWMSSFVEAADKVELEKLKTAREELQRALGQTPDDKNPMDAFARAALDIMKQQQAEREAERVSRRPSPPPMQRNGYEPH